nr:MAG TPA: hypothetical protein [Caudoviricetes sp.]
MDKLLVSRLFFMNRLVHSWTMMAHQFLILLLWI